MMKKVKKQSLKKGDPSEILSRQLLTAHYQEEMTKIAIEAWRKNLGVIADDLQKFQGLLQSKALIPSEFNKNISQTKRLLSRTSKELESTQKQQAHSQAEFEKKFETPYAEGLFNIQDASVKQHMEDDVQKMKDIFSQSNQTLSALAGECQTFHQHLIQFETAFNQHVLPEQITEAVKQSEDLNQRLASIYQTMASLTVESVEREAATFEQRFLPLCTAHTQEALLLSQIKALSMAPTTLARSNPEKH